ncbi:unnamed protein product [Phaedon cochleariae]|uniref:DUF8206 domain-containing protein n=1 Tax=Phaedon cochleariae TaxID=80249 RepID=A0A9P0GSD4_PHACE|nr:unnamed protein product [Phaedon cochleariae]
MSKSKENPKMASSGSDLEKKVKDLSITEKTDINILLLGETGVGKSTFINSVANYLTYADLKKAKNENLLVLIPTEFSMKDKDGEFHVISMGAGDKNELLSSGVSATQDVKTYVFPIWNGKSKVRLIDTPGMGDTRGVDQDDINSENILSYIGQLHELHAICFLFKPNQSRNTVFFKYCMSQILSRLDKSASKNIIFAFTNTRGSDYGPGETINLLKNEIEAIRKSPPHAEIPINRNIFCFDNEAFRYLAAIKNGVEFDVSIKERNKESWKNSVEQCWKMINYIVGDANNTPLKPHHVKSTSAINEARRMINQLAQPLAEISQLINHNMHALKRHEANLQMDHDSLDELKTKLYMPTIDLEVVKMTQPSTVCTTYKCAEVHQKLGRNIWHYKQRCHDPCYLSNITREMIGDPGLVNCAAMARTNDCQKCGCSFRVHQHIYYMTKVKEIREVDPTVKKNINDKTKVVENARKIMQSIINKKEELDNEHQVIVTTCARFAHFLQNNAITPFNDSYKEYIEYLINREQSMGKLCDKETVDHLRKLLREYDEMKKSFDEALQLNKRLGRTDNAITPKEVSDSIQELYKLKHNGKKIKELYECQKKSRAKEHENTEYIHNIPFKKEEDKKNKKEDDKKNKKEDDKKKKNMDNRNKNRAGYENRAQNRGPDRYETQRSMPDVPPPSYQEVEQNRAPYAGAPGAHHSYGGYYPPPPAGAYSANAYGPAPPPPAAGPYGDPYRYGHDHRHPNEPKRDDRPSYDINITVKKPEEPYSPRDPYPPRDPYYPPHPDPYYPHPYPPQSGGYNAPPAAGPYGPPSGAGPYRGPPQGHYYGPHPYDQHHGVHRQNPGQAPRAGGSGNRGRGSNDRGRGTFRGGRGRGGGINKKVRVNKKGDGKGKASDSDDSDFEVL